MNSSYGNITFGHSNREEDWANINSTQYFMLNSALDPLFNFTEFAQSVEDNSTKCGFHYKIATSQYQGAPWPSQFRQDSLDDLNNAAQTPSSKLSCTTDFSAENNQTCTFGFSKDYAYARIDDLLKTKTGKYEFYIHAVSDISDDFY